MDTYIIYYILQSGLGKLLCRSMYHNYDYSFFIEKIISYSYNLPTLKNNMLQL